MVCLPNQSTPVACRDPPNMSNFHPEDYAEDDLELSFLSSLQCEVDSAFKLHPDAGQYLTDFPKMKYKLSSVLYDYFNEMVFSRKLPGDLIIKWNKKLSSTAGYFKRKEKCINLSDKIIQDPEQLIDTMIHEMCHAAVAFIDQNYSQNPHGMLWRKWCIFARNVLPEIPRITVRHDYEKLALNMSKIKL